MNPKTFEQIEIKKNIIGEKGKLLTENLEVSVNYYNEQAYFSRFTKSSKV